jgi:hypothetical protein
MAETVAIARSKETEVAHLDKALGQDMLQENRSNRSLS